MLLFAAAAGHLIEKTRKFQCVGMTTTSVSVPSRGQQARVVFVAIETMPINLAQVHIFEKYRFRV